MRRRSLALIAITLAAMPAAIGACIHLGRAGEAELCRAVLPAVEPEGAITLAATDLTPGTPAVVRIAYSVLAPGRDLRQGTLRCAVRGSLYAELTGRPELVGVEENGRLMGEARLFFLKRFWLADPAAVAEGEKRLTDGEGTSAGG